jgi:hypothetical protein
VGGCGAPTSRSRKMAEREKRSGHKTGAAPTGLPRHVAGLQRLFVEATAEAVLHAAGKRTTRALSATLP